MYETSLLCRPRASISSPPSTPSTTRPHLTSYCAVLARRSLMVASILAIDVKASSDLAGNLDHPLGLYLYGVSVMHYMSVSLAEGGPGLGAMWGRELATRMFHDAGFTSVEERPAPTQDPINTIYLCKP